MINIELYKMPIAVQISELENLYVECFAAGVNRSVLLALHNRIKALNEAETEKGERVASGVHVL